MKKKLLFSCLFVMISGMACLMAQGTQEAPSPKAESMHGGKKYTYAIVYANIHPFFDSVGKGCDIGMKENGIEGTVIKEGAQNGNVSQQIQIVEDLITQQVDGIIIGPCDSDALTPYIDKAADAGIPVLCFDTDAPKSKRLGYVGTDNYKAGRAMGEELGKALNGKGTVICETGVVSQAGLIQRLNGVQDVLNEKYPDIKIVQTSASGGDINKALSDIDNMITSYPDFDALIQVDAAGEAGITAFKSRGWTKKDKTLIVFDDLEPVINGVKDGQVYSTITQGQYNWGRIAVKELYEYATKGTPIPKNTDTGFVVVNADNVGEKY
ncbi:MAG: substrate-binding domain-containing protein [Sphaerochaetaceae bacterium]|jgi:ribose transport system substrate-binding protein